jgi:uncharacterized protein involved in type VI secretion and phage assembly
VADSIFDLLGTRRDETLPTSRIYGAVVGLVTNNKDPEKLGRVKVKFPWMTNDEESHWARIATMDAGKDRGSWWIPEINDEVLCVFEHGDVNFPYVIGGLWNGKDTPPTTGRAGDFNQDGKDNLRFIKSRDDHLLIFEEPRGITAQTASGHVLDMHEGAGPGASQHPAGITAETRNHHKLVMTKGGVNSSVTLKSEGKATLEMSDSPTREVTLTSHMGLQEIALLPDSMNVNVVNFGGGGSINIKCPGGTISIEALNVVIRGSVMVTINGALVKIN